MEIRAFCCQHHTFPLPGHGKCRMTNADFRTGTEDPWAGKFTVELGSAPARHGNRQSRETEHRGCQPGRCVSPADTAAAARDLRFEGPAVAGGRNCQAWRTIRKRCRVRYPAVSGVPEITDANAADAVISSLPRVAPGSPVAQGRARCRRRVPPAR
jgi:hypothetical protein